MKVFPCKWLDEYCFLAGLTAKDVSVKSGLNVSKIKRVLARRWIPSPQDRHKISQVFNKMPNDFIWGHESLVENIYG